MRLQVAPRPEAGERGQVVRRDRDHRLARVLAGRAVAAVGVALEPEQAAGAEPGGRHPLAEALRDDAEVLADDHGPAAHALEGDDAEQLLRPVAHVRPGGGGEPVGYPEEALQPHHVVDPQQPGVAAGAAHLLGEGAVAGGAIALRVRWRKAPVLAAGVEVVRGRPDPRPAGVQLLLRPGVRAVLVDRHRQVVVVAEREPARPRVAVEAGELLVELPLQVLPEEHLLAVLREEGARARRLGAAVRLRPEPPRPRARAAGGEVRLERPEERKPLQRRPLRGEEVLESPPPLARARPVPAGGEELAEERPQHPQLEAVRGVPGDVRLGPQPREQAAAAREQSARLDAGRELRDLLEREVDVVAEQPAQGEIRAVVVREAIARGVQGVEADEGHAQLARRPAVRCRRSRRSPTPALRAERSP